MGLVADLLYFGPALGGRRATALAAAKLGKLVRKRGLAAVLRRESPGRVSSARLGLPAAPGERVAAVRELWAPLGDLGEPVAGLDAVRERARAVRAGTQRLFGQDLEVGWPPDWSWRWTGTPNQTVFAADIRSTWEVQRLQGLLPLARLAGHTGASDGERETAAADYLHAVAGFARAHPGPGGPAWESALEVGLRLIALTQGLPRVASARAWGGHEVRVLAMLDRHARWLAADLSLDKVVRGNHLLGELAGLLAAGALVPPATAAWWRGLDPHALLAAEILAQFHPDGVSVEQSLPYEKFVVEFLAVAGAASARRGAPFPEPVRARLRASIDHLRAAAGPDGVLPPVGDADSGRGADWGEPDPRRVDSVLPAIARLLDLGAAPEPPRVPGVRVFQEGGHAVLQDPERGVHAFVRGGAFGWGVPGPASHSHCDLLAPVLTLGGEPFWVDPGVFGYRVDPALRDGMRSWSAHAAVDLEGPDGPVPGGTFRWRDIPPPGTLEGGPEEGALWIAGTVRRGGAANPLLWHRVMRYNGLQTTLSIIDRLSDDNRGPVFWAFPFAPGIHIELDRTTVRIRMPSSAVWLMRFDPPGALWTERGWVSPAYGRRVEAPVVRRRLETAAESRIEVSPGPR